MSSWARSDKPWLVEGGLEQVELAHAYSNPGLHGPSGRVTMVAAVDDLISTSSDFLVGSV